MAGSQKEFELLFQLKASLGGNFNSTFKSAIDTQKKLQESIKSVNSLQSQVDGYTKTSNAIDKQKEKLARLQEEHSKIAQKIQTHESNAEKLRAKIAETGDATGELTAQLIREENEVEKNTEKLRANERQIRQTNARIKEQEQNLDRLGNELREAGVNTDDLEEANGRLRRSYERLQNSQQTLQRLNQTQQQVRQSISSTKAELAGTIGVMGAVAAAVYAGPISVYKAFEEEMSKVAGITGATGDELQSLKDAAKAAGASTWATATESAQALQYMSLAGWTTTQSIDNLNNMLKIAKITGLDLGTSTDLVTDSMSAMGVSVGDLSHYLDVCTKANNVANTSANELMEAILGCGGAAKTNGIELESLSTALSVLANNGVKGAEAGTALNSILVRMTSNEKSLKETARLGVDVFDSQTGAFRDMGDILKDLQGKMVNMTDAEKDASLKAIAGTNYYSTFAYLLDSVSESAQGTAGSWDVLTQHMNNADGAADEMYRIMQDNLNGALTEAKSALEAVQLALGEALTPALTDAVRAITPLIQKAASFISEHKEMVATVAKVAAGLMAFKVGMLSLKLAGLTGADGILTLAQNLLGLHIGFLQNMATSAGFVTKLKAAGSGLLSYFGNVKGALGGVGSAIGNLFSSSTLFSKIGGLFSGVTGKMSAGFAGLVGKLGGVLTGTGAKLLTLLLKPFGSIGSMLVGLLSNIGGIILNSPLGTIGKVIASSFGKLGTLIAPIGNLLKTALGPLGTVLKTALGPLGGIAGKFLPIIGIITTVIAVVQLLRKNFDKVRESVGNIFGEKGLEIFDKIVATVTKVGETIKSVFSDGNLGAARDKINEIFGEKGVAVFDTFAGVFQKVVSAAGQFINFVTANIVPVVEQLLNVLVTSVIPGIISGLQAAAPAIMQVFQSIADFIGGIIPVIGSFIAGIMPIISEIITFIQTYVFPIISEIFNFIVSQVLPFIAQGIQELGTIITTVLSAVLPVVQSVFQTIWTIIQPILIQILTTVQAVLPQVLSIFSTIFQTIGAVVQAAQQIFSGLIQFITGVFTGNWGAAWEGVKTVFQGAWDGLKAIATGVINGIIGVINSAISALNSIKIPDWVPGVGGKGINIPTFAKGTKNTPDTFIAGEEGPELITNAPGRVVYTAQQTKDILSAQNAAAQAAGVTNVTNNNTRQNGPQVLNNYSTTNNAEEVQAPEVVKGAGAGGGTSVTISNNPVINIDGDKPEDLEAKLEENNQRLLQQVENLLNKKDDDERRSRYD